MNVKSDGGSRQHHYTTKSITIPYVPTRQVPWPRRGRARKPLPPEGKRNKHPQELAAPSPPPHAPRSGCTWSPASVLKYVPRAPAVTLPRAPGGRRREEEVIEVVDEGSVGLSLREHPISRSWCYTYLNCFKTNITERTVRWLTKAQHRN